MKHIKTSDMAVIAVFSALIAVLSMVSIPVPFGVPVTLQTFIIAVAGFTLGSGRSMISVIVYIALGAVGLPVFSGFQGGLGALFGMTGGFIVGFIPYVFMCGIRNKKYLFRLLSAFAGLIICHSCGIAWYYFLTDSFVSGIFTVSLPYLPKDIISILCALAVSVKLKPVIQKFN